MKIKTRAARTFLPPALAALLAVAVLLPAGFGRLTASADSAPWSELADTSWYHENPRATTYTISTGAQLAGLAKLINETAVTFSGKTVTLANSIDLSGREWTPIGDDVGIAFYGVFDGNGHSVIGVTIGTPSAPNTALPVAGLFGDIGDYGLVQNLGVAVSIYSGYVGGYYTAYVGGIAGLNDGIILNCGVSGVVSASTEAVSGDGSHAGGIAGHMGRFNNAKVFNSYSASAVTGYYSSGLAGYVNDGVLQNCYTADAIAGIVVPASPYVGGASAVTVTNCFYDSGGADAASGGLSAAHMKDGTLLNSLNNGRSAISLTVFPGWGSRPLPAGTAAAPWMDDSVASPTNGGYPVLYALAPAAPATLTVGSAIGSAAVYAAVPAGHTLAYALSADPIPRPVLGQVITAAAYTSGGNITTAAGNHLMLYDMNANGEVMGYAAFRLTANDLRTAEDLPGTGTQSDPFTVSSWSELSRLSALVNGGKDYKGLFVSLTTALPAASAPPAFTPIGGYDGDSNIQYFFSGVFDGNNHTISGLNVSGDYYDVALFGLTNTMAVIKNVNLADVNIESNSTAYDNRAAALAGLNQGMVHNCAATGSVIGIRSAGGLVAASGEYGLITDCSSAVEVVTGDEYEGAAGGLVGVNWGVITNSFSAGDVSSAGTYARVGGLVGYNTSYLEGITTPNVINCYATGNVSATGESSHAGGFLGLNQGYTLACFATGNVAQSGEYGSAGGFAGRTGKGESDGSYYGIAVECYAVGDVSVAGADSYAGGFAGIAGYTVDNCYSLGDVIASTGISGLTAGGFVGSNAYGEISGCFTAGSVNVEIPVEASLGAFAGYCSYDSYEYDETTYEYGLLDNCYYDQSKAAQGQEAVGYENSGEQSANITALATAAMTGAAASDNMSGLLAATRDDDSAVWATTAGFYPHLTAVPITVSFEANGGSAVASVELNPYTFAPAAPAAPTKSGNTFAGWHTDASLTSPVYAFGEALTGDMTLYAAWTANNGGSGGDNSGTDHNGGGNANGGNNNAGGDVPDTGDGGSAPVLWVPAAGSMAALGALALMKKRKYRKG